ncbi:MAG TPA: MaoC/PaaZ C-terminal domain-containing protein [Myxococcota bacterium]|nr:MaoC/PaaZ C-terminal domain-containing protein [Myxococcota bacterium]
MSGQSYADVEFGEELPAVDADVSLANVRRFTRAAGMTFPRFHDHEAARKEGLPGAIVPGIMSQGILAALIHRWAPGARIVRIDTVFRAPVLVDSSPRATGVVTEKNDAEKTVVIDLTIQNEAHESPVVGTATVAL